MMQYGGGWFPLMSIWTSALLLMILITVPIAELTSPAETFIFLTRHTLHPIATHKISGGNLYAFAGKTPSVSITLGRQQSHSRFAKKQSSVFCRRTFCPQFMPIVH